MLAVLLIPAVLQAAAFAADEMLFHYPRGLPRWERIGHPLDSLTVAACYAWLVATRPGDAYALPVYVGLAFASCVFITKDEPVHARVCAAGEHWIHAVLFVLHPIVFLAAGVVCWSGRWPWVVPVQLGLTLAIAAYQFFYWRAWWRSRSAPAR